MGEALLSLIRGWECYKEGKYEEAIDWTKRSLTICQENENQEGIADCYSLLGECYQELKKYSEAIDYYKQGLGLSIEKNDHEIIAVCNNGLGDCYFCLNNYSEAVSKFEQSLSTIINHNLDKRFEGHVCYQLGLVLRDMNRYRDSKQYFDKALIIAKQVGDRTLEIRCNSSLSELNIVLCEYDSAVDYANRALSIANEIDSTEEKHNAYYTMGDALVNAGRAREAMTYTKRYLNFAKETGDRRKEMNAVYNLSSCYRETHNYDSAIGFAKKCLTIAKEMGDMRTTYKAFNNIGWALKEKGQVKEAIEYHNKFLQYSIQLNDKHDQATANNNLGTAYMELCKHYKAIEYLQTSLKLYSELGIESSIIMYNNLGVLYFNIGNYQQAAKYFELCLGLSKEARGKVDVYHNLSKVYHNLNKLELAREYLLKAIIIGIRTESVIGKVRYFQELGHSFCKNKQSYEARLFHNKALQAAQEIQNAQLIGQCYILLADTCAAFGQIDEAIEFYERALTTSVDSGNLQMKAECCYKIAWLYTHLVKQIPINEFIKEAETYFNKALQCYEEVFADLREKHDLKITIVDTHIRAYKALALLLIETGRPSEALLVCDRGRACTLRDTLVSRYYMQHNQLLVDDATDRKPLEKEDLQDLLSSERSLLFLAILEDNVHSWVLSRKHSLIHNQRRLDQDSISQDLTEHIRQLIAAAHTSMNVRQMKANECEDRSLGTNETMCQEDGKLQQLTSCMTNMPLEDDDDGIEEKSTDISRNPPGSTLSKPQQYSDIKEPLQELFKLLIAPIKEHLKDDEVVIVPEGNLYMVPFAALQDPQTGRYFCESKRIRIVPSLKTMKILKQCPPDYHSSKGALVVGNPNVGEVIFRGEKTKISRLPSAEREAVVVSEILKVTPLLGTAATKDAVKEKLKEGAAVIHIAAHGDDNTGEIALAPGASAKTKAIPEDEDYILTMQDVQDIGVRAKLVVLSCCHTGRGEIRAEGVIGMARAFLAAGARAVVASLWNTKDRATLDFMRHFYVQLKLGKSASVSLNEAMKRMIRGKNYSHPRYWAPFILIGDDVTIDIEDEDEQISWDSLMKEFTSDS